VQTVAESDFGVFIQRQRSQANQQQHLQKPSLVSKSAFSQINPQQQPGNSMPASLSTSVQVSPARAVESNLVLHPSPMKLQSFTQATPVSVFLASNPCVSHAQRTRLPLDVILQQCNLAGSDAAIVTVRQLFVHMIFFPHIKSYFFSFSYFLLTVLG
jgi:hypothetical protein